MSDRPPPLAPVYSLFASGAKTLTAVSRTTSPLPTGQSGTAAAPRAARGVAGTLAERLRRDPSTPAITFYDDATGERVELSTATLDNWVAKTANLLVDTLGVVPGDKIAVDLPSHWTTVAVLFAAWCAGADVFLATDSDLGDETTGLAVAFVAADRADSALASDADEIVALSLRPLGGRLHHPIAGVLDFAAEVPAHGDVFAAPTAPPEQAELLRLATVAAQAWGMRPGDRVMSTTDRVDSLEGLLGTLLGPLVLDTSVVICRNPDPSALTRRMVTEKVTAVCGPIDVDLPDGVRHLTAAT